MAKLDLMAIRPDGVQNPLVVPRTKTKRFSNSFIIAGSKAYNQSHK
jgi:hypothetical protein